MASETEVQAICIQAMNLLARPNVDPKAEPGRYAAAVAEYLPCLTEFPVPVLQRGMELWREAWTSPYWPMPGRLREFMATAQREIGEANPQRRLAPPRSARSYQPSDAEAARMREALAKLRGLHASGQIASMTLEQAREACGLEARP
jgi:hypothetical protein